jgi:voltage-gated potassium channel Kch
MTNLFQKGSPYFIQHHIILIIIFSLIYQGLSIIDPRSFTKVLSLFDSLYFSITTQTTVGYGDITPNTIIARLTTMIHMICMAGILSFHFL